MTGVELQEVFAPLFADTGGFDSWIGPRTHPTVVETLSKLPEQPLTLVHLNQLLLLSHEAGVSEGFFEYYWLETPDHPYRVEEVGRYDEAWSSWREIGSLEHLRWGLYRFYLDALLYFGNVRAAYRYLRGLSHSDLCDFFAERRVDTERLVRRGKPLELMSIAQDDRYLISEMACKSLGPQEASADTSLYSALFVAYEASVAAGQTSVNVRELLDAPSVASERQAEFIFTATELLDEEISNRDQLLSACSRLGERFTRARGAALTNTSLYLSMVDDLDVYVATSMRTREDFRNMASFCSHVFDDDRLRDLHLRYFDPTLSSAEGHEDKGLIECLMVKCTKALVYFAGTRDSYGKDAEAAMALSLGKPVIFYCDEKQRERFYREVHPLSRLIDFNTGVAVGAMVATTTADVSELLYRIFTNTMKYTLDQPKTGHLKLREELSGCTVRLQTGDELLRETFWNYYHYTRRYGRSVPAVTSAGW